MNEKFVNSVFTLPGFLTLQYFDLTVSLLRWETFSLQFDWFNSIRFHAAVEMRGEREKERSEL